MNTTEVSAPTPRKRLRLVVGGLFVLAVLVALGLAGLLWHESDSAKWLRRVTAELDAKDTGWKLEDILAARIDPHESENSARVVVAVAQMLPPEWSRQEVMDAQPHLLTAEEQAALEKQLHAIDPAVQLARRLADMKVGRHKLVFGHHPWETDLSDQQKPRAVTRVLQLDAMLLAQKGDVTGALRSSQAALNAARSLFDEPLFGPQLTRISCVLTATNMVECSLALGETTDQTLAELQELLADEENHPTLLVGVRGERAVLNALWAKLVSGELEDLKETIPEELHTLKNLDWRTRWLGLSRRNVRQEYPLMLDLLTRYVEAARLPIHRQSAAIAAIDADAADYYTRLPILRGTMPDVSKVARAHHRKTAQVSCLRVLVGVERYRLANRKWPARLEDVSRSLLGGDIPLDPYDGNPLRYKRLADGVIVYSIGSDGMDNGGNLHRHRPLPVGADVGHRLWDLEKRRQPPLPRPKEPAQEP